MLGEVLLVNGERVRENLKRGGLGGGESEKLEKEVVNAKAQRQRRKGKRK